MRAVRVLTIVAAFWAGTVLVDQVRVAVRAVRIVRAIERLETELADAGPVAEAGR